MGFFEERRRAKGRFGGGESAAWTEADLYPGRHFELTELWSEIDRARKDKNFQRAAQACKDPEEDPAVYPAVEIAPTERGQEEVVAGFFKLRLPGKDDDWEKVIEPFLEQLEAKLNAIAPERLTGKLEFGWSENGAFGLFYFECAGAR